MFGIVFRKGLSNRYGAGECRRFSDINENPETELTTKVRRKSIPVVCGFQPSQSCKTRSFVPWRSPEYRRVSPSAPAKRVVSAPDDSLGVRLHRHTQPPCGTAYPLRYFTSACRLLEIGLAVKVAALESLSQTTV